MGVFKRLFGIKKEKDGEKERKRRSREIVEEWLEQEERRRQKIVEEWGETERQLARRTALMQFFERRGYSYPQKQKLPWAVKMHKMYPDLSEFKCNTNDFY